jgi:hypothetical protein
VTSAAAPARQIASGARFEEATQGAPFDIRLHKDSVVYCDKSSKHALKLWPNRGMAVDGFCGPAREPNTSCAGVAAVTSVRTPGLGPDDVLDTQAASVRLKGHVRDCAGVESTVVVATGAGVIVVDAEKGSQTTLVSDDADRVAVSPDWIAWTKGEKIYAQRR